MPAGVVAQQANHLSRDGLGVPERHEHATIFRQQFRGVPVRCGNYCLAGAERVGQGTRRDLRFVEVRRYVKIRGR